MSDAEALLHEVAESLRDNGYLAVAIVALKGKDEYGKAELFGVAKYDDMLGQVMALIDGQAKLIKYLQKKHGFIPIGTGDG